MAVSNPGVISRALSRLETIEGQALTRAPERDEVLGSLFGHMVQVVDLATTMISSEIQAEAGVTVKLLWTMDDGTALVRTFLRNSSARARRDSYRQPNFYPYTDNTAFEQILSGEVDHFASDNLMRDETAGRYHNTNDSWPDYYNTTCVMPIPPILAGRRIVAGFLCADSRFGPMSSERVVEPLRVMSQHLYDILGLCADVADSDRAESLRRPWQERAAMPAVGWTLQEHILRCVDLDKQRAFQGALEIARQSFGYAPFGSEAANDPAWLKYMDEDELEAADAAAIAYARALDPAQHLSLLESVAAENPAAGEFVARARGRLP
ncbi:MAG: hypothetical protein ACREEG_03775 [Phenylobacterium sp.]